MRAPQRARMDGAGRRATPSRRRRGAPPRRARASRGVPGPVAREPLSRSDPACRDGVRAEQERRVPNSENDGDPDGPGDDAREPRLVRSSSSAAAGGAARPRWPESMLWSSTSVRTTATKTTASTANCVRARIAMPTDAIAQRIPRRSSAAAQRPSTRESPSRRRVGDCLGRQERRQHGPRSRDREGSTTQRLASRPTSIRRARRSTRGSRQRPSRRRSDGVRQRGSPERRRGRIRG